MNTQAAISIFEVDDSIFAALHTGTREFLLKSALKAEILRANREVVSGEAIFGPVIAKRLMQFFVTAQPAVPAKLFPELTDREREILSLIAQHVKNPEIAERLTLSLKTVRNHISNIFDKMQVTDAPRPFTRHAMRELSSHFYLTHIKWISRGQKSEGKRITV